MKVDSRVDSHTIALMNATVAEMKAMVGPRINNGIANLLFHDLITEIQLEFEPEVTQGITLQMAADQAEFILKSELEEHNIAAFDAYVRNTYSLSERLINYKQLRADREGILALESAIKDALVERGSRWLNQSTFERRRL